MKISFFDAKQFEGSMKCTIQGNGKMNFSSSAIHAFSLTNRKSVRFALSEEGKAADELFMVVLDHVAEDAFKVNKAGNYFYLNAKGLFDHLGIDYKHHSVVFDLVKTNDLADDLPVYRLIRRKGKDRKIK